MKALLYCTKAKPYLVYGDEFNGQSFIEKYCLAKNVSKEYADKTWGILNGKIIGECDYEASEIEFKSAFYLNGPVYITKRKEPFRYFSYSDLLKASCLQDNEILKYLGHKNGKAIHINNLKIFDEPKELNDYNVYTPGVLYGGEYLVPLKDTPQNMRYVYDDKEKKILIPIRSKWLCNILNGKSNIIITKKVLKEML